MLPKLSYKKRILLYFSLIITLFTVGILFFEHNQIMNERKSSLERMLDNNVRIIHNYLTDKGDFTASSIASVVNITQYLPEELRLTIIDQQGNVQFDNQLNTEVLENHLEREEIQKAMQNAAGSHARISSSNHKKYLYYAKYFDKEKIFVRVALPYDVQLATFLNAQNSFVYFILLFFIISGLLMIYFANHFSKSIKALKTFSDNLKYAPTELPNFNFPDDEVGSISADIVENYKLLQENRKKVLLEREKLLQHFHYSEEGIAIFSGDKQLIYANDHFMQYLNAIIDKPCMNAVDLFSDENFQQVVAFIDYSKRNKNTYKERIHKNGRRFSLRVIIFDDHSFELYISDITKAEKTRLLKQEMTNNIAHELKTPVTSIRGYLETILLLPENETERRHIFLERAHDQTIRLSELIQDISLLTKIEEAADRFRKEIVLLHPLLEELKAELEEKMKEKNIRYHINVPPDMALFGSRTLLYSIFRNLTENSISYGGENIDIVIHAYINEKGTCYIEFFDTGIGVEEKHLVRIFQRFYRINEGRTRNTGGSGLGLSIVKNAVLFHRGSIVAKKRDGQGLLFFITFPAHTNEHSEN